MGSVKSTGGERVMLLTDGYNCKQTDWVQGNVGVCGEKGVCYLPRYASTHYTPQHNVVESHSRHIHAHRHTYTAHTQHRTICTGGCVCVGGCGLAFKCVTESGVNNEQENTTVGGREGGRGDGGREGGREGRWREGGREGGKEGGRKGGGKEGEMEGGREGKNVQVASLR